MSRPPMTTPRLRNQQSRRRDALGVLVSRLCEASNCAARKLERAMLLDVPLVLGRDSAGKAFCAARYLPAPRVSSFVRPVRRRRRRVRLSRLAIRRAHRAMPRDSFAHGGFEAEMRAHLRGQLSVRGARRLRLGLHGQPGRPRTAIASAARARAAHLQRTLPDGAALGRPSLRNGPGDHRTDGPGARPVRAPGLVVAHAAQHPRKSQAV